MEIAATEGGVTRGFADRGRGPLDFAAETGALYRRQIRRLSRQPMIIFFSILQPLIFLVLFGQIFSRIANLPGTEDAFGGVSYLQFFIPTVMLQSVLFNSAQSGAGMITDIDSGFLDKLLTTPINRLSILFGRILGDLTRLTLQAILVVVIGFAFGQLQSDEVEFAYGLPGIAGAVAITTLFALLLCSFNVFIALATRNTELTFMLGQFMILPLFFLSPAQLPLEILPDWIEAIAKLNPVTYAIEAMRGLLNGEDAIDDSLGEAVLKAVLYLGGLSAIMVALATTRFRRSVS
jgi:ABC-2 type transport system permease protein